MIPLELTSNTPQSVLIAPDLIGALKGAVKLAGVVSGVSIRCNPSGWIEFALGGNPGIEVIMKVATLGTRFPDVMGVVQMITAKPGGTIVTVPKVELERLLKLALFMFQRVTDSNVLSLSCTTDGVKLQLKNSLGEMDDFLPCEVVGPDVHALFHPMFIHQAVAACPGTNLTFTMWSEHDPLYLIDAAGWVSLLTPMGDKEVARKYDASRREAAGEPAVEDDEDTDF